MRVLTFALCGLFLFSGCASLTSTESWSIPNPLNRKEKEPKPYPKPVKLAATWAPDTLSSPGKTTTRGFGGRLFFYDEKSRAVPVEGELLVVAYVNSEVEGAPPHTRRFAFTSEQLTSHFSQSDLGASYSIWIPWDAQGGMQTTVTLVPNFTPKDSSAFQGASTVVVLPGRVPERVRLMQSRPQSQQMEAMQQRGETLPENIRQVGFRRQPQQQTTAPRSGVITTTIPMGSDMNKRMR